MEWDLTAGFRRGGALYRFGENGRREKIIVKSPKQK
jgi:hypothetical protein